MRKIEICLEITGEKITKIKWEGGEIKTNIDRIELPSQIERCIEIAEEQIQPKWDEKELHDFILKDTPPRTERQIAILKVLIEAGEWVRREELAKRVSKIIGKNLTPHNLAGPLGGITNRVESLGKERFIEEKWENEKKFYRIKPEYLDYIKNILKE